MNALSKWSPYAHAALRIIAALLFMEHGLMKLFDFPGPQPGAADPLPPLILAAAIIEVVGGALMTVGLFTRVAAFVCSGQMAVAYFMVHAAQGPWPALNGGDAAILFCFVFLYIACAGPGPLSVDDTLARRRAPA
jgi:putative oxidoreductase